MALEPYFFQVVKLMLHRGGGVRGGGGGCANPAGARADAESVLERARACGFEVCSLADAERVIFDCVELPSG